MAISDAKARREIRKARKAFADFEKIDCYTPKQAAEFLGKTKGTLALWRRTGVGPLWHFHSNGINVLYPFEELVRWSVKNGGLRHRFTRLDALHQEGLVTEQEAAILLCVSTSTVRDWRLAGEVEPALEMPSPFNLGGTMHVYWRADIEKLLPRLRPRCGLGRGRGTTGMLISAETLTLDDL